MLKKLPIKTLYSLALSEGEGMGTAYEYFAKRLALSSWLENIARPKHILVAGLPLKYGASMDFLFLADELNAAVTVIDDRVQAIERCQTAFQELQSGGIINKIDPEFTLIKELSHPVEIKQHFDLALSCEVLLRMANGEKQIYLKNVLELASSFALFTPNGDNPDHANYSGLSGISLEQLDHLALDALHINRPAGKSGVYISGYIDMPPFPTGMTRSEDQRRQATSGKMEATAMWGLGIYAQMESWLPVSWRKRKAHIVYSFLSSDPR